MENNNQLNPDKWVDLYADQLYVYTYTRVQDRGIAEDLVQESFLSAWKAKDSFRGEASEKNWLYQICKNKIIDHYRSKQKNIADLQDPTENDYFDQVDHWTEQTKPSIWNLDYEQPIVQKEFYQALDHCKRKLKELQQQVFVLKYQEELDTNKICEVLDISQANYWVLIHRAKLQLRSCLEKNWINI